MIEIEGSVEAAKEHLVRINAQLADFHQAYREQILRERARHEDRLRDIGERFFHEKEPLEKLRDALVKTLVDIEALKGPKPIVISKPESI